MIDESLKVPASDQDLYLFSQGTNYQSYRLLGALPHAGGVTFRVWAPNADQVAMVG